jgi:Tetratricopeptide repeat
MIVDRLALDGLLANDTGSKINANATAEFDTYLTAASYRAIKPVRRLQPHPHWSCPHSTDLCLEKTHHVPAAPMANFTAKFWYGCGAPHLQLGLSYFKLKYLNAAKASFERAAELDRSDPVAA